MAVICLFTDRVAEDSWVSPDGNPDRRGSWHDDVFGLKIGSRLWQLRRTNFAQANILQRAKDIAQEALQPFISFGIASAVNITTAFVPLSNTSISIAIQIVQPTGDTTNYSWAWNTNVAPLTT